MSHDGQDRRAFIHACVLLLPLHLWIVLTFSLFPLHLLSSQLLLSSPSSLLSLHILHFLFATWPLISDQRICLAFPSFHIHAVRSFSKLFTLTNFWGYVGMLHWNATTSRLNTQITEGEWVCLGEICRESLLWLLSWDSKEQQPVERPRCLNGTKRPGCTWTHSKNAANFIAKSSRQLYNHKFAHVKANKRCQPEVVWALMLSVQVLCRSRIPTLGTLLSGNQLSPVVCSA